MDQTTVSSGGQDRTAGALAAGMPDIMVAYAEAARPLLWAVENARAMIELNRTLIDLSRDVLRRQQDAVIEATLRALGSSVGPDRGPAEDGFVSLAWLGFEAFDRMAAAMRAANDAALWSAAREPDAKRTAAPR